MEEYARFDASPRPAPAPPHRLRIHLRGRARGPSDSTVVVAPPSEDPPPETEPGPPRLESAHRIDSPETWSRLAARPDNLVVARTEVVKFLIDLEHERRLWFTDTDRWPIHYHFARDRLGMPAGYQAHESFNERQYRHPDRRFVMGSVVHTSTRTSGRSR